MATNMIDEWQGKSKFAGVRDFSIAAINVSARKMLGRYLDTERNMFAKRSALQQDWQGLAEQMGLNYDDIQDLESRKEKTVYLLNQWATGPGRTIGLLLDYLEELERFDILEDDILQRKILLDVDKYVRQQEDKKRLHNIVSPPVQVPEVDSQLQSMSTDDPRISDDLRETLSIEFKNITIGEIDTGKPEFFDAFVCYTNSDISFVKQMINMLENVHGLKLCIADRDITPGCAKHTVMSYLISKRCNKMVVILSREYLRSSECDFMTKFGHSLAPGARSKKLIPVLIERSCPVPDILRFITLVDYTKCELVEWFWCRLAKALQETSLMTSLLFSPNAMERANQEAEEQRQMEAEQAQRQAEQYAAISQGPTLATHPVGFSAPSSMDSGFEGSVQSLPSMFLPAQEPQRSTVSSVPSASGFSFRSNSPSTSRERKANKTAQQKNPKLDVKKNEKFKFF